MHISLYIVSFGFANKILWRNIMQQLFSEEDLLVIKRRFIALYNKAVEKASLQAVNSITKEVIESINNESEERLSKEDELLIKNYIKDKAEHWVKK